MIEAQPICTSVDSRCAWSTAANSGQLRVVLDSCNGAGSLVGPKLIEALGAEVIPINVTPDGSFPRPAEPLPRTLAIFVEPSESIRLMLVSPGHGCRPAGDRLE